MRIKTFNNFVNENVSFHDMVKNHGYGFDKSLSPEEYYDILLNSSEFNGKSFYFSDGRKSVWANYFKSDGELHTTIIHELDGKELSFTTKDRVPPLMTNDEREEWYDSMKYSGLILKKIIEDRYNIKISKVVPGDEIPGPDRI